MLVGESTTTSMNSDIKMTLSRSIELSKLDEASSLRFIAAIGGIFLGSLMHEELDCVVDPPCGLPLSLQFAPCLQVVSNGRVLGIKSCVI